MSFKRLMEPRRHPDNCRCPICGGNMVKAPKAPKAYRELWRQAYFLDRGKSLGATWKVFEGRWFSRRVVQ